MIEPYYELFLYDPATPSYVSLPKRFIGTKDALLAVADNLAGQEFYKDTVEGIRSYFNGRENATHNIAFQTIPVLQPVHVLEESELLLEEREWDHVNIWDCPYHMRFQSATVSQLLVQLEDLYQRYIRAEFTGYCETYNQSQ